MEAKPNFSHDAQRTHQVGNRLLGKGSVSQKNGLPSR